MTNRLQKYLDSLSIGARKVRVAQDRVWLRTLRVWSLISYVDLSEAWTRVSEDWSRLIDKGE